MDLQPRDVGWIEVISGPMFSGKTEELIRRLRRSQIANQRVQIFKPRVDKRHSNVDIVSHSEQRIPSVPIEHPSEILEKLIPNTEVVGIDEAQFFGDDVVAVAEELANRGRRVICAGLDQDYLAQPFGPMPKLLAVAEYITKVLSICVICGNPANRSFRTVASEDQVVVGAQDSYEARCRRCYALAMRKREVQS